MVSTFFLKLKLDFSISKCSINMPNLNVGATKQEENAFIQEYENSKMIHFLLLQKKNKYLKLLVVFCPRSFHSYLCMPTAKSIQ